MSIQRCRQDDPRMWYEVTVCESAAGLVLKLWHSTMPQCARVPRAHQTLRSRNPHRPKGFQCVLSPDRQLAVSTSEDVGSTRFARDGIRCYYVTRGAQIRTFRIRT
jgi:hypothetical protein